MKRVPVTCLDEAIAYSEPAWRGLSGSRLLLTGCTGFFGVWILESFLRARDTLGLNFELVVLSRDPAAFLRVHPHLGGATGLQFHRGDIRTFEFPGGDFDKVIHGATTRADETFAGVGALEAFDTVAGGTRRMLEFCAHKRVSTVLYIGSGAVYGGGQGAALAREDIPTAPDTMDTGAAVGHGKRAAEFLCAAHARTHPTSIKIARCFSFVGPQLPLDLHYAMGNFIRDAVAGVPVAVRGDGRAVRSYMYMSDLVAWLMNILHAGQPLRPYNVGSEDARNVREVAELVGRFARPPVPVTLATSPAVAPVTAAPGHYVPSTERARRELGLQQRVTLEDAVRRTMDYYR